jgi:3-methyladenine DNA glycosylase AlkD
MLNKIKSELREFSDNERAKKNISFFKTGKGEYGENDLFIGVSVPDVRRIAKEYKESDFNQIRTLLNSEIHEERLCGAIILVEKFKNSDNKKEIFDFYIKNIKGINNWDIVDLSSPNIVGEYLKEIDKEILYKLAKSDSVWERRIAIVSTYAFIRDNKFEDVIRLSEILIKDKHDLIHKASGWMLREMGKRNKEILIEFLEKNSKNMPRTMLRYSIEKLDDEEKRFYMKR